VLTLLSNYSITKSIPRCWNTQTDLMEEFLSSCHQSSAKPPLNHQKFCENIEWFLPLITVDEKLTLAISESTCCWRKLESSDFLFLATQKAQSLCQDGGLCSPYSSQLRILFHIRDNGTVNHKRLWLEQSLLSVWLISTTHLLLTKSLSIFNQI
jgi:hypothetical protein